MNELLRANVRQHARRYVATGLAVAISMAFVVICLVFSSGLSNSLTQAVRDEYSGAAVIVDMDPDSSSTQSADAITRIQTTIGGIDGVHAVSPRSYIFTEIANGDKRVQRNVSVVAPEPLGNPKLAEGSDPSSATEVALDRNSANELGVGIGDTVQLKSAIGSGTHHDFTVSGIVEFSSLQSLNNPTIVVTRQGGELLTDGADSVYALMVATSSAQVSGADQDALAQRIEQVLPADSGLRVRSAHTAIADDLEQMKLGQGTMLAVLLIFPVIALAVAAIVVSTTFQIVLQQRQRELALLRALGARAGQVRSLIMRETIVVGAVSSLVGVVAGVLLGAGGLVLIDFQSTYLSALTAVNPWEMVGVWALGTLLTFLVGMRPALGVARISPIEALTSADEGGHDAKRTHRVRLAFGAVLTVIGAVGMLLGLRMANDTVGFMVAFFSGVVALFGALFVSSVLLPRVTFALGLPFRGVVARMARANTVRNPERTAATGTAIVIGVTLITMMSVGAGSLRATLVGEVDSQRPYDLQVSSSTGAISDVLVQRINDVSGVAATEDLRTGIGSASVNDQPVVGASGEGTVQISGQPDLNAVAHSAVTPVGDGEAWVSDQIATAGDTVRLCASDGGTCVELSATPEQGQAKDAVTVSASTLQKLAPDAGISEVVLKLDDGANVDTVISDLSSLDPDLTVGGAAQERAMYTQMINMVLAVIVGLLGVSVLVALVGVTNTLSLSVHERTRENGLLRALGLTRGQMKRMLAAEALLTAVSGAVVGIVLGIILGWIGTLAIPMDVSHTIIVIPWWQIGGVLVVAVLCAVVASWWPGRRAARTSPVEALASE